MGACGEHTLSAWQFLDETGCLDFIPFVGIKSTLMKIKKECDKWQRSMN